MGKDSKIGWTDHTFNPWHGCTKVGPDCKNCYAETQSNRYQRVKWGPNVPRVAPGERNWAQVLKWNAVAEKAGEMRFVFCMSMGDLFEETKPVVDWQGEPMLLDGMGNGRQLTTYDLRSRLWKLIEATPWLNWLLLTKRPENINTMIPAAWLDDTPANVMFGMSAGNQETFDERFPAFCAVKGRKFLSLEPLLGRIVLGEKNLRSIDWVIVGGESGPKARPCEVNWILRVISSCHDPDFPKVPVYVKQSGSKPVVDGLQLVRKGWGKGENWDEWPMELDDLKVREFPPQNVPTQEPKP